MNITKFISVAMLALFLSFGGSNQVMAENGKKSGIKGTLNVNAQINNSNNGLKATSSTGVNVKGNATSSRNSGKNLNSTTTATTTATTTTSTSTATNTRSVKSMGESHRSIVASFVQSLLAVAERDGGIGPQVRVIAQAQNESASTTASAIVKIEDRSALKTFLFGTDFKTLGELKNEVRDTKVRIGELKDLMNKTTSSEIKAELSVQVTVLENDLAKVEKLIKDNEGKFSVFGWFVKIFK
jgi:hypothetical protein